MKILLIAPPLFLFAKKNKKQSPRFPPYTLVSIGSILQKNNFEVKIYDAFAEHASIVDILEITKKYNPQLIGIIGAELNREIFTDSVMATINNLKNKFPQLPVILLGIISFSRLCEIMKIGNICYSIFGDPEEAVLEIAQSINVDNDKTLLNVSGLVVNRNEKITLIGKKRIIMNLDLLPYLDWNLINFKLYPLTPHTYKLSYPYSIIASRGCPWNRCAFCDNISIVKTVLYRVRSPKNIVSEIALAITNYGIKEIRFEDVCFNTEIKWLKDFRDILKEHKINIPWSCLTRIDRVGPEELKLMREAGCWRILFGIESSQQRLLDIVEKGYQIKDVEKIIKWCREIGIETIGSFLIGLPGEKPNDVMNSVKFAKKVGFNYVQFFLLKLYHMPEKYKIYGKLGESCDYSNYAIPGYPFIPSAYRDLNHLKKIWRQAYFKFYFSPRIIVRHLRNIDSLVKLKRILCALLVLIKIRWIASKEA